MDPTAFIDVGRILLGLVLNTIIMLVLVYRMADIPQDVRKPGTILLVVFTTVVWWLTDDKHGWLVGDMCVLSAIPILFLFTKSCCRVDWDVAWKVAAIFFVIFATVVVGLDRGTDAIAPDRKRLTVQFHRMLDEQAGVVRQRPTLKGSIEQFQRGIESIRTKVYDTVTRKKSREKLQTGLNVILKEQMERQRMFEEAGYGDMLGGNIPQGEINLTGSLKEISAQFDEGVSILQGIKEAQDRAGLSDDEREEAMLRYREQITAEKMKGRKLSVPAADLAVDSDGTLEDLLDQMAGRSKPNKTTRSGGGTTTKTRTPAADTKTPSAPPAPPRQGWTAPGVDAEALAAEPSVEIGAEDAAPRETMIDSEWSAKHEQIAWANTSGDPSRDAVTVSLTTYDQHEGLHDLTRGGTAAEWKEAHDKLKVSGIMKSDTGGYVVLIGVDLYYPGDLVNVDMNGTSFWWRLSNVTKRDVDWDPAGLRLPGEEE